MHPRWERRHEGVLLWLIDHPCSTLRETARATGYSRSQVSRIVNSPGFRRRYRRLIDRELIKAVRRRLYGKAR